MPDYKQQIAQNFSRSSEVYEEFAVVQRSSAEILAQLLLRAVQQFGAPQYPASLLDIGVGTGILLEQLSVELCWEEISGLDFAPDMLARCEQRWLQGQWICADAEDYQYSKSYSCIASNFALQWFGDIEGFVQKSFRALCQPGYLALALPLEGSFQALQDAAQRLCSKSLSLHPLPIYSDLEELREKLRAGLGLRSDQFALEKRFFTSVFASPLEALRSIKRLGASYRGRASLSFEDFRKLEGMAEEEFQLEYQVAFIVIAKT